MSREGQRALARFHKQHPLLPGMTLKVHIHWLLQSLAVAASPAVLEAARWDGLNSCVPARIGLASPWQSSGRTFLLSDPAGAGRF